MGAVHIFVFCHDLFLISLLEGCTSWHFLIIFTYISAISITDRAFFMMFSVQTTFFIPTLDTTTKFVLMTIGLSRIIRLRVTVSHKLCKNIVFNT